MGDILSKAEIDALLGDPETDGGGAGTADKTVESDTSAHLLTDEQKDILGEIGNISMGTAATTLFALLRQKVLITTPRVFVMKWKHIPDYYDRPSVGIRVNYTAGLKGANVLVLKETDVKIIADLMMGGDGAVGGDAGLTDLDMSAISEAMNQMVGSASTSLSSLLDKKIDIDAPRAFRLDFTNESFFDDVGFEPEDDVALVSFRMEVGTLIDSEIMQLLPIDFALSLVDALKRGVDAPADGPGPDAAAERPAAPAAGGEKADASRTGAPASEPAAAAGHSAEGPPEGAPRPEDRPAPSAPRPRPPEEPVNVQPARFQSFEPAPSLRQKENIDIIMDVPLEVTVELGRTKKKIREILEFTPGTIVELDKIAGEPIDVMVNGKFVAKGEVVVIDENFGIRITEITGNVLK